MLNNKNIQSTKALEDSVSAQQTRFRMNRNGTG